ncbi:putative Late embryogenesis abundant protein [Cocos nucifera]|uniref:Putative Late embryogenesis abundant protein n=1 Tax=Cocos nucifera TaxID=13894 RepID=A0A8K0I755_COCNU|nr:putative Late embryogenesis abundant protein [Cocos nucifera]
MDSTSKPHHHSHRRHRWRCCVLISAAVLLFVALLLLVLGLTVFRPRHAVTTINSVHLAGLRAGLDVPNLGVDLNVTLDLDITASNPNHASFRYGNGSADLYYRGNLVGEAAIPPGEVAAGGSVRTEVLLTVMAGRLIGKSAVYADVISGSLPFTTTTEIPGRVTVFGVFKHHMVTSSTCDIVVNVRNRSVENTDCKYKTKL